MVRFWQARKTGVLRIRLALCASSHWCASVNRRAYAQSLPMPYRSGAHNAKSPHSAGSLCSLVSVLSFPRAPINQSEDEPHKSDD